MRITAELRRQLISPGCLSLPTLHRPPITNAARCSLLIVVVVVRPFFSSSSTPTHCSAPASATRGFMSDDGLSLVIVSGCATIVLASALAYVVLHTRKQNEVKDDEAVSVPAVDKTVYPGGQISIYYGTQTGTAEQFARQLEREGPDHGFLIHVVDLEDTSIDQLVDAVRRDEDTDRARAIFLSSTYGEGESPDNATAFVNDLKERACTDVLFSETKASNLAEPESCLVGLDYCVFGLGNRQYDHFNAIGRFLDHALERVGANRVMEVGLGNDDADLEGDFEAWKDTKLWPLLKKLYVPEDAVLGLSSSKKDAVPECPLAVEYLAAAPPKLDCLALEEVHSSSKHYFTSFDCPVKAIRELRTEKDPGSTVHVEVDLSTTKGLSYTTADNLGVLPLNDNVVVESVAKSLGLDLDSIFRVKAAPDHEWHGAPFPMPLSVRDYLQRYCDLTQAPRRSELKLLAAYAKDPVDRSFLERLSSKEGRKEYREKIVDGYVGLVDLLQRCPSIEMPLEHFINLCPSLQTRFFTISSSSSVHPQTVHLTVAVTRETKPDGELFKGVCSNYLASRKPGDIIRVYNRPSTFRLPSDSSKPILMVGPGTGVAPMRALLQERAKQRQSGKTVGCNVLYFGCKSASQDYIYRDEMESYQADGTLSELHLAFSRDQKEKIYVQHLLQKNAEETWKLIDDDGAYIYVCGGVKMGHDVGEALKEVAVLKGQISSEHAKDYFAKLAQNGRYVQELWA